MLDKDTQSPSAQHLFAAHVEVLASRKRIAFPDIRRLLELNRDAVQEIQPFSQAYFQAVAVVADWNLGNRYPALEVLVAKAAEAVKENPDRARFWVRCADQLLTQNLFAPQQKHLYDAISQQLEPPAQSGNPLSILLMSALAFNEGKFGPHHRSKNEVKVLKEVYQEFRKAVIGF